MIIDTHAHLSDERFDPDRGQVIERAFNGGIETIIEIACEPSAWDRAFALMDRYPSIKGAVGIHPQEAEKAADGLWLELERRLAHPSIVALGEAGLDYHREYASRDIQKAVFVRQLELARSSGKPLSLHVRDAWQDALTILKDNSASCGPYRGVMHCFSGSIETARIVTGMGFLIGVDGPLTFPRSEHMREAFRQIPIEAVVLETDSPYLSPQPFRGKRNEPLYLRHTLEELARVKGISPEEAAAITTANAKKLFNI